MRALPHKCPAGGAAPPPPPPRHLAIST